MNTTPFARSALLLALAPLLGTGCLFIAPPPDPGPGDITFLWSFDGEGDCTRARVDEVDVYIVNSAGSTVRTFERIDCFGGGLTIENLDPGTYDVELEAFSVRGVLLYTGAAPVTVASDQLTDMGVIELGRAGDATKGDITFLWSFGGEVTCEGAGVAEVDLELVDSTGATVLQQTEDCYGGGLTIRDVDPGSYTLYLDAYSATNEYLFAGSRAVTVSAGQVSDLGELELDAVGGEGTLAFDVGFLYPSDMAETSCAVAGVVDFDVVFVDENDEEIDYFTVECDGDGLEVLHPLASGDHRFFIDAFGRYMGDPERLYLTDYIDVTITPDTTNDLGLLELYRDSNGFADIRVEPTLPMGETCATLGLTTLNVDIVRLTADGDLVDYDNGMLDCTETFLEVDTFVPGSYRVDISGVGTAGTYIGTATLNAAPGMQTVSEVALVLD